MSKEGQRIDLMQRSSASHHYYRQSRVWRGTKKEIDDCKKRKKFPLKDDKSSVQQKRKLKKEPNIILTTSRAADRFSRTTQGLAMIK
jgi:hypothetical protein